MQSSIQLTHFWPEIHRPLRAFIFKQVKEDQLADDILQDTFLKVQRKVHTLRDGKKLIPWIYQIARNHIIDYQRHKQVTTSVLASKMELEEFGLNAEGNPDAVTQQFSICVVPFIKTLPPKYRDALILTEIEGVSQKELAKRLGISYSAAKSRVQRGREKLKALLLECCDIQTDMYGNIIKYEARR